MIAIAKASDTEREVLFGNAAYRAGMSFMTDKCIDDINRNKGYTGS